MNAMDVTTRRGTVTRVSVAELAITVRGDETGVDVEFCWTSFWSRYPHQRPEVGDAAEIVCRARDGGLYGLRLTERARLTRGNGDVQATMASERTVA